MNEGERWEKLPRFVPYFCLPLGFTLLSLRFLQVARRVLSDDQVFLVASHEVEENIADDKDNSNTADSNNDVVKQESH